MSIFSAPERSQAYLKAGFMGFAGAGKTYTASVLMIGLVNRMRELGIVDNNKPVAFLDTETGSDWVKPMFDSAGIPLVVARTRAFKDLVPAVKEAEANCAGLLIDSISHFWTELMDTYAAQKRRRYGLEFQDWAWLKKTWRTYTDEFVNSQCHIIMCGRAGFEYDFFTQESGKRELIKTAVKMKAETETGYEPSILVLMEKYMDMETKQVSRQAHILKDRASLIDGKTFINPVYDDFGPHIGYLNLGGQQIGVENRDSAETIPPDGKTDFQRRREQHEIALDEIKCLLTKHYPGTTEKAKAAKQDLLEKYMGTRSWVKIEKRSTLEEAREGLGAMRQELEQLNELQSTDDETPALNIISFKANVGDAKTVDVVQDLLSSAYDMAKDEAQRQQVTKICQDRIAEIEEQT